MRFSPFADRVDGGRQLAAELRKLSLQRPVVLAMPRGGVPVGFEVATALGAPLEVFVARKIGAPGHPEFGIGAVAEGDGVVANEHALRALGLTRQEFDLLVDREKTELGRRVESYRRGRALPSFEDRDVILVDDGLATGVTAEAGLLALRSRSPRRLVLAAPAGAPQTLARLASLAEDIVCVISPPDFRAVGQWYWRFDQITDVEVVDLLDRAASTTGRDAR